MGDTAQERGYDNKWRRYRNRYLKENPLCKFCADEGNIVAATVVDHITPHKRDAKLFWSTSNHQPLCSAHHQSTKQRMENGKDMPVIGDDGWPV